jgi:hypothetical protein
MPNNPAEIEWHDVPEEHNYPAALSYLSLILPESEAARIVELLRRAPMSQFQAKDVFRASGLPLLGLSNSQIKKNQDKIANGKKLSPLLLMRDPVHGKVVIADGYHRMCAVYAHHEDAWIPCKIV